MIHQPDIYVTLNHLWKAFLVIVYLSPAWGLLLIVTYLPKEVPGKAADLLKKAFRCLAPKKKVLCTKMQTGSWWLLRGIEDPEDGELILVLERAFAPWYLWQMVKCVLVKPIEPFYRSNIVSRWKDTEGEIYFSFESSGSIRWNDTANKYSMDVVFHNAQLGFELGKATCVGPERRV